MMYAIISSSRRRLRMRMRLSGGYKSCNSMRIFAR